MEAHPGGQVEVEIGVMHHVQPPQSGHRVKRDVLAVDHEVERHHRQHDLDPERPLQGVEQSPPERAGRHRDACRRDRKHEPHQCGVDNDDPDVARPPHGPRHAQRTARRRKFPQCDESEHADERTQPNVRFEPDVEILHRSDLASPSILRGAGRGYWRSGRHRHPHAFARTSGRIGALRTRRGVQPRTGSRRPDGSRHARSRRPARDGGHSRETSRRSGPAVSRLRNLQSFPRVLTSRVGV